ncbi:MAG: hypothetical protein C0621_02195 [Desulfuromonas sp.]|nr:MAG: hypothetical protein C0621_02195 [Desulfuromonas sp.]
MTPLENERGMVLLLVLVVIALLSALLIEIAFSTQVDLRLTETYRDSTRAYYLAKGGIQVGRMLLKEDNNSYDANDEMWAQGISNYPLDERSVVSVEVKDLDGRLDLNRIVDSSGVNPTIYLERFQRLLEELGADDPEGLSDALFDWVDSNNQEEPHGAEEGYYLGLNPPYPAKNGALDTIEELRLVRGFTAEVFELVAPHVTVRGGSRLNLNTATPEVLLAWDVDMTAEATEQIVEERAGAPFASTNAVQELIGIDTYSALNRNLDVGVTSSSYHIVSRGGVNEGGRRVEAVYSKSTDTILYLKVN